VVAVVVTRRRRFSGTGGATVPSSSSPTKRRDASGGGGSVGGGGVGDGGGVVTIVVFVLVSTARPRYCVRIRASDTLQGKRALSPELTVRVFVPRDPCPTCARRSIEVSKCRLSVQYIHCTFRQCVLYNFWCQLSKLSVI